MVKASKRSRPDAEDAGPSEAVEPANKRSRGTQRQAQPAPEEAVADVQAPVRDRREVMADVARR